MLSMEAETRRTFDNSRPAGTEPCLKAWKTYLKSWREKQTYKSRTQALIQVHSLRTLFFLSQDSQRLSFELHKDSSSFKDFLMLLPHIFLFPEMSYWISFLFSFFDKSCLFNGDIFSYHSDTIENQNFPIDTHFPLQHFTKLFC